jgi:hypothetical protein
VYITPIIDPMLPTRLIPSTAPKNQYREHNISSWSM